MCAIQAGSVSVHPALLYCFKPEWKANLSPALISLKRCSFPQQSRSKLREREKERKTVLWSKMHCRRWTTMWWFPNFPFSPAPAHARTNPQEFIPGKNLIPLGSCSPAAVNVWSLKCMKPHYSPASHEVAPWRLRKKGPSGDVLSELCAFPWPPFTPGTVLSLMHGSTSENKHY